MHPISWLKGLGLGAAGMYFLDPEQGKQRQAEVVDQCAEMAAGWVRAFDHGTRDVTDRLGEAWQEVVGALDTDDEDAPLPVFARSPGIRLAAGAVGALWMVNGVLRRRPSSLLFGAVGLALFVQAVSAQPTDEDATSDLDADMSLEEESDVEAVGSEPISAADESLPGETTQAGSAEEVEVAASADLRNEASDETRAAERRGGRSKKSELERAELGEA